MWCIWLSAALFPLPVLAIESPQAASLPVEKAAAPASQPSEVDTEDEDEDEDSPENRDDGESEATEALIPGDGTLHFTADMSDVDLEKKFCSEITSLGSISVGFADAGRLINGVQVPKDDSLESVIPAYAWGTQETVEFLVAAARAVKTQFPDAPALRVNHIGKKDGGYLRPHKSHQSGRDVDLGFYYKNNQIPGGRRQRTQFMELGQNWALIRALVSLSDVQVILVDRKVQKVLYDYALSIGEDRAWLDDLFHSLHPVIQHARHHRDHFHVRFFSPRSQELGRRVQPILNKRPDENIVVHRIRNGDNLGKIARKYGSTVSMIQKHNGMRNTFLRVGRSLSVPMRGPCTHCPIPPPLVVPARHLPPQPPETAKATVDVDTTTTQAASTPPAVSEAR